MLPRQYDDLPNEIKLHVFSFLSAPEVVAACSVNVANHAIIKDEEFWCYRASCDFYPGIEDINSLSSYLAYKKIFDQRIEHERRLFVTYVSAVRFLMESERSPQQKETELDLVQHSLEHLGDNVFLQMMNCEKYGNHSRIEALEPSSAESLLFNKLVMKSPRQVSLVADEVVKELPFQFSQKANQEYVQSLTFALSVLAKCNAHLALRVFLHKMGADQRRLMMHQLGAHLLCSAAELGRVEVVKELFAAGASPNSCCFVFKVDGLNHHHHPLVMLMDLLFKIRRAGTRGNDIKTIITMFIANGMNADLSGVSVLNDAMQVQQATPSLRSQAAKLWRHAESHRNLYRYSELVRIGEILHSVISAPTYCSLARSGIDNRNDCAHSTHTSLPPQHRRQP